MPPTTRRSQTTSSRNSTSRTPSQQQQTLNFRSNTKVTKPAVIHPGKQSKTTSDSPAVSVVVENLHKASAERKYEPELEEEETKEKEKEKEQEKEKEPEEIETEGITLPTTSIDEPETDSSPTLTTSLSPSILETPLSIPSIPPLLEDLPEEILHSLTEITPSAITTYHKTILSHRKTSPIHQSHLSKEETILRNFDLSYQYGPCIGITRINRWKRAYRMGLKPPMEVLKVLVAVEEREGEPEKEKEKDKGGKGVAHTSGKRDERTAFLDEELSSRTAHE